MKYCEDLKGPVNRDKLKGAETVLKAAYEAWPPMTFSQTWAVEVMCQVEAKQRAAWGDRMPKAQLTSWSTSLAKQFRAMTRHFAQGLITKKDWAHGIINSSVVKGSENNAGDGEDGEGVEVHGEGEEGGEEEIGGEGDEEEADPQDEGAEEEEEAEEEEAEEDNDKEAMEEAGAATTADKKRLAEKLVMKRPAGSDEAKFASYDNETEKAWRMLPGGREREWSDESLIIPPDAKDTDNPLAKFLNGDLLPVKGLTIKILKAKVSAKKTASAVLWETTTPAGMKLMIKRKPDRTPLLILFKYTDGSREKQICQVALKVFGDIDDADR